MTRRPRIRSGLRLLAVASVIAAAALASSVPGLRLSSPVLAGTSGGCAPSSSTCFLFDVRLGTGPGTGTGFGTFRTKNPIDATYTRIVCAYGNETQDGVCGWGYAVDSPGEGYTVLFSVLPDPGSQACQGDTCYGPNEFEGKVVIFGNYLESSWYFNLIQAFQIDVVLEGTGSGTVTSSPAGIDCPEDCTDLYAANYPVTLTATAATGSVFAGWSGDYCTGKSTTCEITTDFLQAVTATFNKQATARPATAPPTREPTEEPADEPTEEPIDEATPEPTDVAASPTPEPIGTAEPTIVANGEPAPTDSPSPAGDSGGGNLPIIIGLAVALVVLAGGAVYVAKRPAPPG